MNISIIVAVAKNNVIGYKNRLPWHIPEDLERFKKITTGHCILMGQKTYESIGRPLPNRKNIVLSDNMQFNPKGCITANSIDDAIKIAHNSKEKELMVIGGASVYLQLLPLTNRIYLTRIDKKIKGDTYFPVISNKKWQVIKRRHQKDNKSKYIYEFQILERKA